MNFRIALLCIAAACLALPAAGQLDRTKKPGPGPAPAVAFPAYSVQKASNGLRVIVVRNTELPTVSMRLFIDREPVREGEVAGVVDISGALMRNGTTKRTKDKLDEDVDRIGASLNTGSTSVYASGLTKYTEQIFELMSDVTLHPSFPQSELDKILIQEKSGLKYRKADPGSIVELLRRKLLFGAEHPYGETVTEETVGKITRAKCLAVYNTWFKPNHAILAVVGDVEQGNVMKLVQKYFGAWKQGKIPTPVYPTPAPVDRVQVALVDRAASVQSVIRVAQTVDLKKNSPDVVPVEVMNTVLGGGIFRLFLNLREKHAYTYGAYSNMGPDRLIGSFNASTSVANKYTDSSITEILYEIKRIRSEKVGADELEMAKSYLSGGFARSLETADNVASRAIDIEVNKLPKDYYQTYLKKIEAVTSEDVQRVAQQYLQPDRLLIALVANAKEVQDKLLPFGPVAMYDEEGNPAVVKAVTVTMTPAEIFAKHIEKSGGSAKWAAIKDRTAVFNATMQGMMMNVKTVQKAPGKFYQELSMMGMVQKTGFDGEKAWGSSPRGLADVSGEGLEELKTQGPMNFCAAYAALGYAAEVTGMKTINGKECIEVTFTKQGAPMKKHYFGSADFLVYRETTLMTGPQGPVEQAVDLSEYKEFSGVLFPTRLEQSAMGQLIVFTLGSCEVNTGVSDTLFVKPAR